MLLLKEGIKTEDEHSSKLQTNLLAIQNWLAKWKMKANGSKSTHFTITTRTGTYPPVHINNVQLPLIEEAEYLGLHLNRRLTWHKHIFTKRKQPGIAFTKMYWLLGRKSKLYKQQTILRPMTLQHLLNVLVQIASNVGN
jgi:hypothetical protein